MSVSKLFQIYNLTQNAEYGNYKFYFLKPPSLQGRECFTANLSSLEKDLNEIEHIKDLPNINKYQKLCVM